MVLEFESSDVPPIDNQQKTTGRQITNRFWLWINEIVSTMIFSGRRGFATQTTTNHHPCQSEVKILYWVLRHFLDGNRRHAFLHYWWRCHCCFYMQYCYEASRISDRHPSPCFLWPSHSVILHVRLTFPYKAGCSFFVSFVKFPYPAVGWWS